MTPRTGLLARHPRLQAGLWFAAFFTGAHLILDLALRLLASRIGRGARLPAASGVLSTLLIYAVAGAGAAAWLGAKLFDPEIDTVEGVRRGAWIGIVTGIGVALIGLVTVILHPPGNRPATGSWLSPVLIVLGAVFKAGQLLPVGALAGWGLVRVNRSGRGRGEGV